MKKFALLLAVFAFCALPALAARRARIKVINQSKWEIHHLYLSSSDADEWGPDQLEDEILAKGDSITLTNIRCDHYDIKVVDEDGDECVIEHVSLCRDNSYWKITDKALLECENAE
ncbi:MAG TPA: hypothetical protein VMU84_14270 [Thermoanaerobaculia bacterium]|nr:hypothetical protein [Thermoanaerobaculia bacterium]